MGIFDKIVEQVTSKSFANMLSHEDQVRKATIGKSWDYYNGDQVGYIKQYRGESTDDFADKDKPTFNYTKLIVDEYISGVFGKPVNVNFEKEDLNARWGEITSPFMFGKMAPFMKKVQRISEVSETCLVMVRYDKVNERPYYETIRGEFCYFVPDPNNPREVGTLIISYVYDTGDPDPQKRFMERIEIWNKQNWELWLYSPSMQMKRMVNGGKNPYGFIPMAVFKPEEDDNSFYGISGTKDIVTINETYNNLWVALTRISIFQSFSVLVVTSDGEINIEVAPTRYIKLPIAEHGDAKYITPNAKIDEVRKVLLSLKEDLQDFSRVPASVFSSQSSKGAPQSGYALKIRRIPIEQVWESRRQSYGPSYSDLARKTLIVDKVHQGEEWEEIKGIVPVVEFSTTTPGMSPDEQLVQDQFELRYNIISPVDIFLRSNKNIDREEAIKRMLDIKKENELLGVGSFVAINTTGNDDVLQNIMNQDNAVKKQEEAK